MPFGWKSEEQFRKEADKYCGLSKKTIHVDTDKQPTKVEQTSGQLYTSTAYDPYITPPVITCPCCGNVATGIAAGKSLYQIDVKETNGKTHKGDVPPCPVGGFDTPPMGYVVEPCSCRVSQEWAGAFAKEVNRRMHGEPPCPVAQLSPKAMQARMNFLTLKLGELYGIQANAATPQVKEAADYWVVIVADLMQRLCPGPHCMSKTPLKKPVSDTVKNWAAQEGLAVPAAKGNYEFQAYETVLALHNAGMVSVDTVKNHFGIAASAAGIPVYVKNDGMLSTTPSFEGQIPYGTTAPSPGIDKKHPNQTAPWHDPVPSPVLQTDLEPVIVPTLTGVAVRFRDVYKEFWNKDDAEEFAHELCKKHGLHAKPKHTLQTLPVEGPPYVPLPDLNKVQIPPLPDKGPSYKSMLPDNWKALDKYLGDVVVHGGTKEEEDVYLNKVKEVYTNNIKSILTGTSMPIDVVKQVWAVGNSNPEIACSIMQSLTGKNIDNPTVLRDILNVQYELKEYITGKVTFLTQPARKYVQCMVDWVELPAPETPKEVPAPSKEVPPATGVSLPPIDRSARRRRKIRQMKE